MKKTYLLAGLLAGATPTLRAQQVPYRHQLSAGAFGLAPNLGAQYHYRLNNSLTLGVEASHYFAVDNPGVQVGVVGRYYFLGHAPTGLYAQLKVGAGLHHSQPYNTLGGTSTDAHGTTGAMLGIGYQARFGQRWVAQVGGGFKAYTFSTILDAGPNGRWEEAGQPGSPLDAQVSVGYLW